MLQATAATAGALSKSESVVHQLQLQLGRLSEGFNKQVEEVMALREQLKSTQADSVPKGSARSWIVNFVESVGNPHSEELLRLIA